MRESSTFERAIDLTNKDKAKGQSNHKDKDKDLNTPKSETKLKIDNKIITTPKSEAKSQITIKTETDEYDNTFEDTDTLETLVVPKKHHHRHFNEQFIGGEIHELEEDCNANDDKLLLEDTSEADDYIEVTRSKEFTLEKGDQNDEDFRYSIDLKAKFKERDHEHDKHAHR